MFVQRDFIANYKQTVLGPIWFLVQPLLTTIMYTLVFGRVAGLAPAGIPMVIFYLSGITVWNYFSDSLNKTATVFRDNAYIFGKVYFPRLTMPVSIIISSLLRFFIQFGLFLLIWSYYYFTQDTLQPNIMILLTPLLIIIMGLLALGLGMIISAMTTKYRDLIYLLGFGIQLLMFATPVIYPLSRLPKDYRWLIMANPMSPVVETFRYAFTGDGTFSWAYLAYSFAVALLFLGIGTIIFNKVEKTFTDTV
ncbi:MAG TPA: ABC transporter permease, partial [Segetibacter sp.]